MKALGYITATLFISVYGSIINGWALAKLWAWFVAGLFGLPLLSIPQAIGLEIVIGYTTHQIDEWEPEDKPSYGEKLLKGFLFSTLKPFFALLIAVIVKAFL